MFVCVCCVWEGGSKRTERKRRGEEAIFEINYYFSLLKGRIVRRDALPLPLPLPCVCLCLGGKTTHSHSHEWAKGIEEK